MIYRDIVGEKLFSDDKKKYIQITKINGKIIQYLNSNRIQGSGNIGDFFEEYPILEEYVESSEDYLLRTLAAFLLDKPSLITNKNLHYDETDFFNLLQTKSMKGFDLMDFIEDSKTYVNVSGKSLYDFIKIANKVDNVLVTEKDILDAAFVFATERP